MPTVTAERLTARDVLARLERHYIKPGEGLPGGVFLPEVTHDRQGGARCDALYVGFTTSRGRYLIGHEVKVARSDWLHELDQPEKADVWASQCHSWYVVAPSADIVRPDELPPGWGLLTCDGNTKTRLKIVRAARDYPERQPSWTAALSIISRQDTLRANAISAVRAKAREDAYRDLETQVQARVEQRMRDVPDVTKLQERLAHYEMALGITVHEGPHYRLRDGQIPVEDLHLIGELLRRHRTVREALNDMFGRYSTHHLDVLGKQLAALSDAIEGLRKLGTEGPA